MRTRWAFAPLRPQLLAALCLSSAFAQSNALASSETGTPEQAPDASGHCEARTTLQHVACQLAARLPALDASMVVVQSVSGGPDGTQRERLSRQLGQLLQGYVSAADGAVAESVSVAQFRARKHRTLIWLRPSLDAGRLDVTLDVYESRRGFWERVQNATPGPIHHDFATGAVDAELRSFMPTRPLVVTAVHVAKLPVARAYALACGDVNADAALDVVVADRHAIHVGHVVGERFESVATARWTQIAAVAPTPLREPIVTLHVPPGGGVDVGSSDRMSGAHLGPDLVPTGSHEASLPWPGLGCTRRAGLGFERQLSPCSPDQRPKPPPFPGLHADGPVDTLAGMSSIDAEGHAVRVLGLRGLGSDALELHDSSGRRAIVDAAGAQAALGDLDLDGAPEVAVSKNTFDRTLDSIRVFTWNHPRVQLGFELPVPGGVDAIAMCPSEGALQSTLLLSTGSELWAIQ